MGTPDFAVSSLDAINSGIHTIVGVVTSTDKKAGRGQKVKYSPVKNYAIQHNLNLFQPDRLKSSEFVEQLKSVRADLFVVVAFRMLPEIVWNMPPKGTINLHGSLLPNYRGAAPLNHAIINGELKTGVTTFFIEKEIDTGKIIDTAEVGIGINTNAGELHDELMITGAQLLIKTIDKISDNNAVGIPQSERKSDNHKDAPKIFKETCQINWSKTSAEVHNQIRGLSPYPAAWSTLQNKNESISFKLFRSELSDKQLKEGEILCNDKDSLEIGCTEGSIKVLELQMAGKKKMDIKSFLNGVRLSPDHIFTYIK